MPQLPPRTRGVIIALAGTVAVSPDAMLLRWMRSIGASSPDVAVAKYIGIICYMLGLGACRGLGGSCASPSHFAASAFCQLAYQLSFTFCLLLTDAAKALLLISLAPLWAALLGVLVLREPLPMHTVIALAASVVSVGLVFTPRLLPHGGGSGLQLGGSLVGDLLALFTGFAQGASLTVNRHAAVHAPKAELSLATAFSSLGATVVALYLPCYDTVDAHSFWACTPPMWRTPGGAPTYPQLRPPIHRPAPTTTRTARRPRLPALGIVRRGGSGDVLRLDAHSSKVHHGQ